jgi:CMP-N-acetylneuraminic acid synthetase
MKKNNFIAIIPARKGSKEIKNKNFYLVNKHPLIFYTIKSALKCKDIDDIYVTTDSKKILDFSEKMGTKVIQRPLKYSNNISTAKQVVKHFLSKVDIKSNDILIYLQPTSPCRNFLHINNAIKLFNKYKKPVISVVKNDEIILKSYLINGFNLKSPYKKNYYNLNRQQLPHTFKSNGAIYLFTKKQFIKASGFPTNNSIGYLMSNSESVDVDNFSDLKNVKKILNKNYKKYL